MQFRDLVGHLQSRRILPVTTQMVADLIREHGGIDHFIFVGVDLETADLRGFFCACEITESEAAESLPFPYTVQLPTLVAKVYYARNQPADFVRLVQIKELLHLLDPDQVRTATKEQAARLVDHLAIPAEVMLAAANGGGEAGLQAKVDFISDTRAVIAMVPEEVREKLCDVISRGKLTHAQAAELVGTPQHYVPFIISDVWPAVKRFWMTI